MSEQKKYIGKKRQKIFSIEKYCEQPIQKNITRKKMCQYSIDPLISSEEIPSQNPHKIYLNLDESNEKINNETQKHSLIGISKLVFEYLKKTINSTGNDVTEHIKNKLQSKKNDQLNQKNIQRRVYDAINVMCAIGLIRKNKQKIQFLLKNPQKSYINNLNEEMKENDKEKGENEENIDDDERIKKKEKELEDKTKELLKDYLTWKFYKKYYKLNDEIPERKMQKKIEFPFDIIKYDNKADIKIKSNEDSSRYLLLSNSEFIHLNPYDIIKRSIFPDISLKLNENINNINDVKSNSKKSTNDNSLVDELNYNLNNNEVFNPEHEEKKSEETPKKNKVFPMSYSHLNYIIPKEQNKKKTKEEKEDELIFNFVKNKKCFLDELASTNDPQVEEINAENNEIIKIKEEPENNFEKECENIIFTNNRFRKNSNISYCSNFYEENTSKRKKSDLMSEFEMLI